MSTVNLEQELLVMQQRLAAAAPRHEEALRFHPPTTTRNTRFGFISTFPPTRCGLASFTDSLAVGLASMGAPLSHVMRTCGEADELASPAVLSHAIVVGDVVAQRPINPWLVNDRLQDCDVVIVQHEFGIFGGHDGEEIIPILEALDKPVIVVLHTVLEWPTAHQKMVIERVADIAALLVVMTNTAEVYLVENYTIDAEKLRLIPHGVPVRQSSTVPDAPRPGTILTWGLMGPGKGIEWGIMALALLQDQHPDLTYTVIGQTHPKVFEREGDHYRMMLARLAEELGVEDRVIFDDRYIELEELASHIQAADIVLLPYDARHQVTSGVLVEALAAGKKVISTAFPHALELLSDGPGEVVKHESPQGIAEAIERLLAQDSAPLVGLHDAKNSWPHVAQQFLALADAGITQRSSGTR